MQRLRVSAALTCTLLAGMAAAEPLATFQNAAPVTDLRTPALDGTAPIASAGSVRFPLASPVNPNFGGFRVAPSTPAHAAGDTGRNLSSVGADFDHDGCADVVAFQRSNLTVMRGDCKGGFTKLASQATAFNVYHPVAVDADHDGYPDIVAMTVPFAYSGTVVALLNQKNGQFSAPTVISRRASVFSGLMAMNVHDINGDGNADVIIAGTGTSDAMTDSNLVFEVVFGNADGSFATATLVETVGPIPYKPTFGYDGATALRTVGGQLYLYGLVQQSRRVNGTIFGSQLLYRWTVHSTGVVDVAQPEIVAIPAFSAAPNKYLQFADLDGDGIDDLSLLNGDGMLYTALGTMDGGFGAIGFALPATAGNNAAVLSYRDVDGDGKLDAILAGTALLGAWPGNGDGTFRAPKVTNLAGFASNANAGLTFPVTNHVIDDFDGDGVADIAFFDTVKRALCFHKGKADGTFIGAPALVSTTGDFQTNGMLVLATPDLDGDGHKDIIVSTYYGLLGGISDAHGGFAYKVLSPLQSIAGLSSFTADFNQDGKDDVVFLAVDSRGGVHLYAGFSNGDGTVRAVAQPLPFASTSAPAVVVGDINGDGAPDLLLAHNDVVTQSYGVWPLLNDGKGAFTAAPYINLGVQLLGVAAGDANGDGAADLWVSFGSFSATTTAVYLSTKDGGFAAAPSATLQRTMVGTSILAEDVTGDGAIDALVTVQSGANQGLMLYVGRGDGTFGDGASLVTGVVPSFVGAEDLNGDAIADVFFTTSETVLTDAADRLMGLVVLRGTGNSAFAAPVSYAIYGASSRVLPFDLMRNGTLSLLAAANGAGTTILLNNGASSVALAARATTIGASESVEVVVRVAAAFADQPLPTGEVSLLVDGAEVVRGALRSNGTASFTLSALTVATHVLTATYAGDRNYNVNRNSNTVDLTVTKATPAFQLTSDAASLVLSGGSTSTSLSLTANNAFSGPVALTCDGAPAAVACSFSLSNVTLAPGQTVTSTLTLTATKTASLPHGALMAGGGLVVVGLLVLALVTRKRRAPRLWLPVLALVGVLGALGCSSDSAPPLATPRSYAISVTATPADTSVPAQTLTMIVAPAS